MRAPLGALLLAAAACTHLAPFSPRALSGQTLSLRPGWDMALAVDGSVLGHLAIIHLAVEEPLSRVTEGCFDSPPEPVARVDTGATLADAGPGRHYEEQVVAGEVRLGGRLLGDVRALRSAGAGCQLTLGSEVLIGFVLEVNPEARTVTFHAEMPARPRFESEASVVVELTLDPRTDRPSLAVQVASPVGPPLTLPMLLFTAEGTVSVSASAGRLLEGRDVAGAAFAPMALALAPGWALHHLVVSVLRAPEAGAVPRTPDAEPHGTEPVSGTLGADAWGHFRALIDLRGQKLVLFRRPPAVEGGPGPESWTHLSSTSTLHGSLVRLVSWQTLDAGGQLPLEPAYVSLKQCRVGLTLGPLDPGASLEVTIPWPGLTQALPECARELATVPAWTGELAVASESRACQGTCVFAQELKTGRTVCSCATQRRPVAALGRKPEEDISTPEAAEPVDPPSPRRPSPR
jgi:hypothetical protein